MTEVPNVTRLKKTTTLGDALRELVRNLGMEGKLEEQQAVDRWPRVVGERVAAHARAVFFDGGKLFVECDSATWSQELHYMKPDILNRLDQSFGKPLVRDIIFTNTRR